MNIQSHVIHTYEQALDFLLSRLPAFYRIGPAAYKKDLTNIIALCEALGKPYLAYPTIHIAGTNGKGSTAHLLAAILQSSGLKTGLYISPHYIDFRERIKINGEYISHEAVLSFVQNHLDLLEKIEPSFFEMTLALGLDYFREQAIDLAVIETGLGGTLDSTNIVQPILAIITNISFDHQAILGNTLPEIATQKAGIIKTKAPVIIGEEQEEIVPVFTEKAAEQGAAISFASRELRAEVRAKAMGSLTLDIYRNQELWLAALEVPLGGTYQTKNICTVLQAVIQLQAQGYPISEEHIRMGIAQVHKKTRFMGRWQVLGHSPMIVAESAHNEGGLRLVVEQLREQSYQTLHFVFGTVGDKDLALVLDVLPRDARYYFCKADLPRALDQQVLQQQAAQYGLVGKAWGSVAEAIQAARDEAKTDDLVFIGGSIFVVGEAITALA